MQINEIEQFVCNTLAEFKHKILNRSGPKNVSGLLDKKYC